MLLLFDHFMKGCFEMNLNQLSTSQYNELKATFIEWHRTTNQSRKYNMRYTHASSGFVDRRTHAAFRAFAAGFLHSRNEWRGITKPTTPTPISGLTIMGGYDDIVEAFENTKTMWAYGRPDMTRAFWETPQYTCNRTRWAFLAFFQGYYHLDKN